jgi:excisionase family DNA binding protein
MDEYWDVPETAKRTRTSKALWRKLIAKREIAIIRIGRCVRLDPQHVAAWLKAHTQQPKGDSK